MASGLPAVCARAASLDEWLDHRQGGLLVPQGDEDRLTAAVLELLADPDLRRRYGQHNRRIVTARVQPPGPQLEQLYQRLLQHETGSAHHFKKQPAHSPDTKPMRGPVTPTGADRASTS
jgi:hypothetical protein